MLLLPLLPNGLVHAEIGVGAKPTGGARLILDGSRQMLDQNWTYWKGPRFASSLPIKWKSVDDPVLKGGKAIMTFDPAAAGGKYGTADIVTKKKYRDFRLHVEFLVMKKGGNSGVYLQNRYEIQVLDGDRTKHGMGAVINETESPYGAYRGVKKWNSYDIVFRAARFRDGKRSEKAIVTMYFNGQKVHKNQRITKVWGGANSGLDGGNDGGNGITDVPGGLKLQCEGHDVRYRNVWIKELDLKKPNTDFKEPVLKSSDKAAATVSGPEPPEAIKVPAARAAGINPKYRPAGDKLLVGKTGRYHIYTDKTGWNVLMTSQGRMKYSGKLTVHGGTFRRVKPVGLERKNDKMSVSDDKRVLEFAIQTAGSFDGFEFSVDEKDAWVEFELKQGDRTRKKRIFIGKSAANPKGAHFAMPAATR
jgi:hypothetical protein